MRWNISRFVGPLLGSLSVLGCGSIDDEPPLSELVTPLAANPPASCAGHTCSAARQRPRIKMRATVVARISSMTR
jgi:hypothetical protein